MADQVLHGKVLLFFARYLAVDIFGLSVMIVVIIARGRRSSELRARGRKRSVGREVSRRATKFGAEAISAISVIPLLTFARVTSPRARAGPLRVIAGILLRVCAVLGTAPAKKPISSRRRSAR